MRKLVLYGPAWPHLVAPDAMRPLEELAGAGDWDAFCVTFIRDLLQVPAAEFEVARASELWAPVLRDAEASLGDLRAISRYDFRADRFGLRVPVLLQVGTESPRDLYVTDALAAVLPNARIEELPGQAHEGMTTAPEMYAEAVARFLFA